MAKSGMGRPSPLSPHSADGNSKMHVPEIDRQPIIEKEQHRQEKRDGEKNKMQ